MPTFDRFCEDNGITGETKERFLDYIGDGVEIDEEDIESGEDISEENLKSELEGFKGDYPEFFDFASADDEP
jgi:hypothetical protein